SSGGLSGWEPSSSMTTLVTGATGFLGSHVARLLVERGDHVRLLVRSTSRTALVEGLDAERVVGALRDTGALSRARAVVDVGFHVAPGYRLWARAPHEIYESNVPGTRNLLDAARHVGVSRFVYTSTVATVAVEQASGLPDENTTTSLGDMIGWYKRSK